MRVLLVALLLLVFFFSVRLSMGENSFAHGDELKGLVKQQQARNERFKERNRILAAEVESLRSKTAAIEDLARNDLGMIKKDETFFLVLEERKQLKTYKKSSLEQDDSEARDHALDDLFVN